MVGIFVRTCIIYLGNYVNRKFASKIKYSVVYNILVILYSKIPYKTYLPAPGRYFILRLLYNMPVVPNINLIHFYQKVFTRVTNHRIKIPRNKASYVSFVLSHLCSPTKQGSNYISGLQWPK